jgi:amino acid transporter
MLGFLALGFTVLALSQMPAYAAGELRRPRRNSLVSMIGALVFAGAVFTILAALASHTFGDDFLGGMTRLYNEGSEAYPNIPPPFFLLYTSMLTDSATLVTLMTLGVVVALVANIALTILVPTRNVLAYSLDNVLPEALRKTHPRFHSPTAAVLLVSGIGAAILAPYVYGPPDLFNFVFSAATLQAIVFVAAAAAAIVFPWRARAVFESSPYPHRLGGVPVITILGVIAFCLYAYFAAKLITDDRIGANSTSGLIAVGIGLAAGVVIYAVSWAWNKSRGVDLGLAYKELPPE